MHATKIQQGKINLTDMIWIKKLTFRYAKTDQSQIK